MTNHFSNHNPWAHPENLSPEEQNQVSEFERKLLDFEAANGPIPNPFLDSAGIRTVCNSCTGNGNPIANMSERNAWGYRNCMEEPF